MHDFAHAPLSARKYAIWTTEGGIMALAFKDLSKSTQERVISKLALPKDEETVLRLRYIEEMSYSRIAAEMHMTVSSVGSFLTRTRKHVVQLSRECYDLADDDLRKVIDLLGWREIDWPVIYNRNKLTRGGK